VKFASVDYSSVSSEDLAFACLSKGDEACWLEFIRRFNPLISATALRVARHWDQAIPEVVDDLVQETYLKLCTGRAQILARFKSSHPNAIYGFVAVFTANLAQDHFKAQQAQKRGGLVQTGSLDDATCRVEKPEMSAVATVEKQLLLERVAMSLENLLSEPNAERDRQIFWLYYRVGLSASAIAALPSVGLSTKGVESTILRLTRAVRKQLTNTHEGPTSKREVEGIGASESL
jgi:RNA polymerase sigma-70 factor (ECF subfamily)